MNKNNFNSIDKIKTPVEWKAKALNIPCTQINRCKANRFNFYRLAASFCLTFVCLISIIIFIHMNYAILSTNLPINIDTTQTETQKTDSSSKSQQSLETTNNGHHSQPTKHHIEQSENTDNNPQVVPTNISPSAIPSTPTTPISTKPTIVHTTPSETQLYVPTHIPTETPKTVVFNGSEKVENAWGTDDVDIYCKVIDSNGNLLGSNDLFDEQHEAVFVEAINNIKYYSYFASDKGLTFTTGCYTYVFYKRNGYVIYSGTQYIS